MLPGLLIALCSRPARTGLALGALLVGSFQAGCNDLVALPDAGVDAGSRAPHEPAASPTLDAGLEADAGVAAADAEQATVPIPPERAALCARPADDAVRDIFCKGASLGV